MKRVLLFLFFSSIFFSLFAQSNEGVVRVGYINKAEFVNSMPEIVEIEENLIALQAEYEVEYQMMLTEYNERVKAYLEQQKEMTEPLRLARQAEITERESRMNLYRKRYLTDVEAKRKEAYRPIINKVEAAIKSVAEELQLTIVFDQTTPVYMSSDCVDILPFVIKELN